MALSAGWREMHSSTTLQLARWTFFFQRCYVSKTYVRLKEKSTRILYFKKRADYVLAAVRKVVECCVCQWEPSFLCHFFVKRCPLVPEQKQAPKITTGENISKKKEAKNQMASAPVCASLSLRVALRPPDPFVFKLLACIGFMQVAESHYQPKVVTCPMWDELVVLDSWGKA